MPTIAQRLRQSYYASQAYHNKLRKHAYDGRRGVPPDPVGGNAADAAAICDGNFRLLERLMHLGDVPWNAPQVADRERERLHRFLFLDDLRADGSEASRDKARDLVMRWITAHGRWHPLAWRSDVLGARLAAWLRAFSFVTDGAEERIAKSMDDSIRLQAAHLPRAVEAGNSGSVTFDAAEGLLTAGITLRGYEDLIDQGITQLAKAIDTNVLADGCHMTGNPIIQIAALERLLRIHAVLSAGQVPMPARLISAIETMVPAIRTHLLGDGLLTRLNGCPEGDEATIKRVLAASGLRAKAVMGLSRGGVSRLQCGQVTVVMDTGAAFAASRTPGGHAGLFAFEMSHRKKRIIVNCGAHPDPRNPWHSSLRATAAHSTVIINDTNAAPLGPDAAAAPMEDTQVIVRRNEHEGSQFVQAVHGGYRRLFAVSVSREIYVSANGDDVRGRDSISFDEDILSGAKAPKPAEESAARFHLHPDVSVSQTADGGFYLRASPTAIWRFRSAGGTATLEDSVYVLDNGTVRRTQQIIVRARLKPEPTTIKWSLRLENT